MTNSAGEFAQITRPISLSNHIYNPFYQILEHSVNFLPHMSGFSSLPSPHSGCPSQTHEVGMHAGSPFVQLKVFVVHDISPEIKGLTDYSNFAVLKG